MNRRTLPVAAVGLSFTAGCRDDAQLEPIVGTWDAIKFYKGSEDVTSDYLYSGTDDEGCTYQRGLALIINPDLVGGVFNQYTYACPNEAPTAYSYGSYIRAESAGAGSWVIPLGWVSLNCALDADALDCDVEYLYDYYYDDEPLRVLFERR